MNLPRMRFAARSIAAAALLAALAGSETRAEQPTRGLTATTFEFQGVKDREPITFRDMGACAALLQRAREARPAELAERARRDVGVSELWDHPEDYRAVLLELRGFCRRVDSSASKLGKGGRLNEVWITIPKGEMSPFACIVENFPDTIPINAINSQPVIFRGFFLKVIAYDSGAGRRGAPLLIGRLERIAGDKNADPLVEEQARRLPLAVGTALALPDEEDRFVIAVDGIGALVLEDKPVARRDLSAKLENLAAQVHLNARALGMAQAANRELPAVIVIQAGPDTRCSSIFPLMLDCRRSGFARMALQSLRLHPAADRLVESRVAPATRGKGNELPAGPRIIPIQLGADDQGRLVVAEIGELQHRDFDSVRAELTSIVNDPELPFDRARISVDPRLLCSELGRVMEVLMKLNVTPIELNPLEER